MAEDVQRFKGSGVAFKEDKGGVVTGAGPTIGIVKDNFDPTRSGRLRVYLEDMGGPNEDDQTYWRTVSYMTPFYGVTPHSGTSEGTGTFVGNRHSYGMWFTPPDLGVKVMCFFVGGDPNEGYYIGAVPEPGYTHMIPAIGARDDFANRDSVQSTLTRADQLPVTEINNKNTAVVEDPRYFDSPKPVHNVVAGVMMQQGLINDPIRGPIGSHSQRESPSTAYGISTPGKPIYEGGLDDKTVRNKIEKGEIGLGDVNVIGRRGGHTFVMDDGNLDGLDQLIRLRTSKGHQITMSDDGNTLFMIHANGQSWIEMGKEGTIDMYAANSINMRSSQLNLHADTTVNIHGTSGVKTASKGKIQMNSDGAVEIRGDEQVTIHSESVIGVRSDGVLNLKAEKVLNAEGGDKMHLLSGCIGLNSGGSCNVIRPSKISTNSLPDTFLSSTGWESKGGALESIVTRAPTHQPYVYANLGARASVTYGEETATSPLETVRDLVDQAEAKNPTGINIDEWNTQPNSRISLGSINQDQVTGLLAQLKKDLGQDKSTFNYSNGAGIFGLSAENLETTGFLKPGTVQRFLSGSKAPTDLLQDAFGVAKERFQVVLESPQVWTGKSGISNITSLLGNEVLQTRVQEDIYSNNLSKLRQQGLARGTEKPSVLGGLLQAASRFGIDTVKKVASKTIGADTVNSVTSAIRNAKYAVDLVDTKLNTTVTRLNNPGAYAGTVNRNEVDKLVSQVIDNEKVPKPDYRNDNPRREA